MRDRDAFSYNGSIRIRNILISLLLTLFLVTFLLPHTAYPDNDVKRILVIHSYHDGLTWTDDISDGIYSIFRKDDSDIELHTEYMDTKRYFDGFDGKYLNSLLQVYRNKFENTEFDVIISSDDNALRFLLMHHKDLFPSVPIVFCGVNYYEEGMLTGHENITGVLEFLDQQASIDIAMKLHPEAKRVAVITDDSTTGNANRELIKEIAHQYMDNPEFIFLDKDNTGLTEQELLGKLSQLPEGSIVYYSDFLRSKGKYIDQEKTVPLISRASRYPIYTHYDEILGLGVVGGKLVNGYAQGHKAAEMARRILEGTPVSELPVYKESINRYMFNYEQMKRFGIDESELPENSIVVNKSDSFYEQYKERVWAMAVIIMSLLALIVVLNINIARRKAAEEKLRTAHDDLEQKVKERTEELTISNQMLQEEVSERKKAEEELSLRAQIVDQVHDSIITTDMEGYITSWNKGAEKLYGYTVEEVIGKHILLIYPEERHTALLEDIITPLKENGAHELDDLCMKKNGDLVNTHLSMSLIRNPEGIPIEMIGYSTDITKRKKAEEKINMSLKEKEVLLKEIHHRVKNNMAVVSSLLHLQSQYVTDEDLKKIFSESRNRIAAMALVHEKLYQSKDFIEINLREYIQTLIDNLFNSYNINKDSVRLVTDIDNVHLDIDRLIPCGLILNELISNSLKHAFQDNGDGEIKITFKKTDSDKVFFRVSDNGSGTPEDVDTGNPQTLGLKLVSSLARQLRGDIKFNGNNGLAVEILFDYKMS